MDKKTWYLPVSDTERAYIRSDLGDAKEVRAGHNLKIQPAYSEGAFDLQKDDWDKERIENETRNILSQFKKGVINSTENMFAAFGRSAIEGIANFANLAISLQTPFVNPVIRSVTGEELDLGENLSSDIQASFQSIINNNKKIQGHLLAMKRSNDAMLEHLNLARDDKDGFFFDVGQIPAQLGLSFILKDPKMVGIVFGTLARRHNIEEEQEAGNKNAENVGTLSGITTGIVNAVGFHFFTKALKTRGFDKVVSARVAPFLRAALAAGEEGIEEFIDETQEAAIMNLLGSRNDNLGAILQNSAYAGLLGVVGGAPFAAGGAYYYNRQINDVHEIIRKKNSKATKEDAKRIVDAATTTGMDKKVQDDIADIIKNQNSIVSYRNGQVMEALKAAQEAIEQEMLRNEQQSTVADAAQDEGIETAVNEVQKSALVEDMQTDDNLIVENNPVYNTNNTADIAGTESGNETQIAEAMQEWQKKGTDSKYFKKWFGNSKVVDDSGKPLIVYHGTTNMLSINKHGFRSGEIWLTDSKVVADSYQSWQKGNSQGTLPLYIKIAKPYYIDAAGRKKTDSTVNLGYQISSALYEAQKKGFDGIIIKNIRDHFDSSVDIKSHTVFVVFNPEQIKSVDNQGTFDGNNPNILAEQEIGYASDPIKITAKIPEFEKVEELRNYIFENILPNIKEITVKDTGDVITVSKSNIKRDLKRKDSTHNQVYGEFKNLFENAKLIRTEAATAGKNVKGQKVYAVTMQLNDNNYNVEFRADIPLSEKESGKLYFAGHKISAPARDTVLMQSPPLLNEGNNIIEERRNFVKENNLETTHQTAEEQLAVFEDTDKTAESLNNKTQYGDGSFTAFETKLYNMPNYTLLGDALSGTPKITSPDEVAYLFRNLEQAGTENAFAVMVFDDGRYEVLYISNGTARQAAIPMQNVMSAVSEKKPKQLYFVHNHPGGTLHASSQDIETLKLMKRAVSVVSPETKVNPGIIIDLDSGQYGLFSEDTAMWSRNRIDFTDDYRPDVYQFGKVAYYQKVDGVLNSPRKVSEFLSKQKRGLGSKVQAVFVDSASRVQKYVILPDYIFDENGNIITGKAVESLINASVGTSGNLILSGNRKLPADELRKINETLSQFNGNALDYVMYKENEDIVNNYFSYLESGVSFNIAQKSQSVREETSRYRAVSGERFENVLKSDNEKRIINYFTKRFLDVVLAADSGTYDAQLQKSLDSFKAHYKINKNANMKAVESVSADYIKFLQSEVFGADMDAVFERMNNFVINLFARTQDFDMKISKTAERVYDYAVNGRLKTTLSAEETSRLIDSVKSKEPRLEKKSVKAAIDLLRVARLRTPKRPKSKLLNDIKKLAKRKGIELPKDLGTFDFAAAFNAESELYPLLADKYSRYFAAKDRDGANEDHGAAALELVSRAVSGEEIYTDTQQAVVDRIDEIESAKEAAKSWFSQTETNESEFLDVVYALYDDAGGAYDSALIEKVTRSFNALLSSKDEISADDKKKINEIIKDVNAKDKESLRTAKNKKEILVALEKIRDTALENVISEQDAEVEKSKLAPPERQNVNVWVARAADAAMQGLTEGKLTAFKNDLKKAVNRQQHLTAYHKQLLLVRIEAMKDSKDFAREAERFVGDLFRYESEDYKKYISEKIDSVAGLAWKIQSGKWSKGKYLAEDNEYFAEIEQISKMNKDEAAHYLSQIEAKNAGRNYDERPMSAKDKLLLQYLFVKANDVVDNDMLKSLYDKMLLTRAAAAENKTIANMLGDMRHEEATEEMLDSLKNKKFSKIWGRFVGFVGNMETLSNYIFGKKAAQKVKTLEYALRVANISASIRRENSLKRIAAVYGLKDTDAMIDKWLANEKEKFDFVKTFEGKITQQEISRNNLIYIYTQLLNSAQRERYIGLYGPVQLQQMIEILSEQDKAAAIDFVNLIDENFDNLNKAYIQLRGFGIPRTENYFPSTGMSTTTELDLLADLRASANIANQSFTQQRVRKADMPLSDPFKVLYKNINATEAVIHAGENLIEMNKLIKDARIRNAVSDKEINKDGIAEDLYKALRATIDYVVLEINGGLETISDGSWEKFDRLTGNLAVAAIGLKPIIAMKQMLTFINYAEEMPAADFVKYGTKFWENPVKNFNYVFNNDYYRLRYKHSTFNEILRSSMTSLDKKTISLKNVATFFIRGGDALANSYGSWIYIEYLKKQGKTEQEAFDMAIDRTENSQQSSLAITQANFQNAAKKSHVSVLTAFTNTSNQYLRKVVNAIIDYNNGEIKGDELSKKIGLYVFINGWLYGLLTYGLKGLFADDDDDRFAALRSVAMSPLDTMGGFLPIIGEYVGYVVNSFFDKALTGKIHKTPPNPFSLITDFIERLGNLKKILDGKADSADLAEFIGIATIAFTGIDTKILFNYGGGVSDILSGDILKGAARLTGYTRSYAEKSFGKKKKGNLYKRRKK